MSFEINKPTINVEDTIHYLVTRPIAPVVDDGNGNYNISPIGFPVRDTSGELGVIPTRITPEFVATYNNLMGSFNVSYTSNKPISELYGSMTIQLLINTLTYSSGTVTATSLYKHGYVNGASGFISQPAVANGASELFMHIWGDAGVAARSALGVAELPLNSPVEVELTVEVE